MDTTLDRLLELSDVLGRIQGVIDNLDENYINDAEAVLRIRELLSLQEMRRAIRECERKEPQ